MIKPHNDSGIPHRTIICYNLFIWSSQSIWPGCVRRPLGNPYSVIHPVPCRRPAVQI